VIRKILIIWAGLLAGVFLAYFLVTKTDILNIGNKNSSIADVFKPPQKIVIGFLPFWLIDKAQADYSQYITQLSYYDLTIDSDGTIQKFTAPGESDPGWLALESGKIDDFLSNEKSKGVNLSLTIFSGDDTKINSFLNDPNQSAQNLVGAISPIINQYGFTDINLDIEKVSDASPEAQMQFTDFVKAVRSDLDKNITITVDIAPIAFVKNTNLDDPKSLAEVADYIVLMDYDYHNPGSFVTGPVSPQSGAGVVSEFDTESAVQSALTMMPASKLILAIPLYGYSWETINPAPRSAILPGSAFSISSQSVRDLLSSCASCSAQFDNTDEESHVIYKDVATGTYHQIFYPDKASTQIKVNYARSQNLAGMALWALGYEDPTILTPLAGYSH
jgi:spore germination protein YaaH